MGTSTYDAPWRGSWDGFSKPKPLNPIVTSGSIQAGVLQDDKSSKQKTAPNKWRAPTPYTRTIVKGQTRVRLNGRIDYESNIDLGVQRTLTFAGVSGASNPGGYVLTAANVPDELAVRTEQRALAKIKQQKMNLSVAFGERAATAEHLALTAGRILGGLKAARKFDVGGIANALSMDSGKLAKRAKRVLSRKYNTVDGKAHSLWLEAQYGWKPLLSDVHGAVSELIDRDNRFEDRYRTTCTAKAEQLSEAYLEGIICNTAMSGLTWQDCRQTTRTRFRCYARFDWVLENPMLVTASELGMTNPLETAWELLPFSFVADWFTPLGTYLSSMDAGVGWSFKGGSLSKLTRSERRFYPGFPKLSSAAVRQKPYNYSPVSTQKAMRLQRQVYLTPPPVWMPSPWGAGLGPGSRAMNAIALLGSFFRK